MQIYLVREYLEKSNPKEIHLPSSSTISSWIIDYYFENFSFKTILGCSQMFEIYRKFQSIDKNVEEFWNIFRKKLTKQTTDSIMNQYETYLNRYDLIDIIDVYHQCQLEINFEKIFLSKINIRNNIDRMIFQYWIDLPTIFVDIDQTETNEDLFQLIESKPTNTKNQLKNILCTYFAFLLDKRNEYVFDQCRKIPLNIEDLRMIIEENEQTKIEPMEIFRQIIELICQQFENNQSCQDLLEEFSQCFQSLSASSKDFRRLLAHVYARQTNDLPIMFDITRENRRQLKTIRKCRSLDLSIIYETSFESESTTFSKACSMSKRQPLREICLNTFDSEQYEFESEHSIQLKLISDDDKENIPILKRKRSFNSTKSQLANKKFKNIHFKSDAGQPMITNFFPSAH